MIPDHQENTFKELIQSIGYETAPEHILNDAIKKLESEKSYSISSQYNILPRWTWPAIAVCFIIFTIIMYEQSVSWGFNYLPVQDFFASAPSFDSLEIPSLALGKLNYLTMLVILSAVMIQFIIINAYYRNRS